MAITLNGTTITMNDASTIVSTTTHQAIGSYARFTNWSSGVGVNGTTAGTNLGYNNSSIGYGGGYYTFSFYKAQNTSRTSSSGTWRNMDFFTCPQMSLVEGEYQGAPAIFARTS